MCTPQPIGHKLRLFGNSQIEQMQSIGFAFAFDQAKELGILSEIGSRVIGFTPMESGATVLPTPQ